MTLRAETVRFLEAYRRHNGLPSFSATVEAAVDALQALELERAYREFAVGYEQDAEQQREAEAWLDMPMDES